MSGEAIQQFFDLYFVALEQCDGDKDRARALVEAYLAAESGLLPVNKDAIWRTK